MIVLMGGTSSRTGGLSETTPSTKASHTDLSSRKAMITLILLQTSYSITQIHCTPVVCSDASRCFILRGELPSHLLYQILVTSVQYILTDSWARSYFQDHSRSRYMRCQLARQGRSMTRPEYSTLHLVASLKIPRSMEYLHDLTEPLPCRRR